MPERRSIRRLAHLLALGFGGLVATGVAARAHEPLPSGWIRVVAPAPGMTLTGGSTVEVGWEALRETPGLVEWEAFLSLDGGRSYPFRLTPHLSTSRSRFLVEIPDVASRDARFLLRFGDERDERELALPGSFRIRPAQVPLPAREQRTDRRGEAARPGQRGVVAWVEGTRDGRELRRLVSHTDNHLDPTFALGDVAAQPSALRVDPPLLLAPAPAAFLLPASQDTNPTARFVSPPTSTDLRLRHCRANE